MSSPDLVIRSQRVVLDHDTVPASIHITNGVISSIVAFDESNSGYPVVDVPSDCVVSPGLVDTHVHINEPGRTEWEGFWTATRAAAAGGVTTLVDMPLNNIPATTTIEALDTKLNATNGQLWVDTGFWGGVVPGNVDELAKLHNAGVVGFKCFLIHSGVDEFPNVTEQDLRTAMKELVRLNALLIVHAEVPAPVERATAGQAGEDPRRYSTFLRTRPNEAEDQAVELIIRLSRESGARVHIVHHSSASSLSLLRDARSDGVPVTIETCPHYLSFAAEDIPDGETEFKCCPPIRDRANSESLWGALDEGLIEMVVSDHSPCPPEMKRSDTGDFLQAWGGIASLQLRLPIMWTAGRARGYSTNRLAEWLSHAPARLAGLQNRKGRITAGHDADFVIWNPDEQFSVDPQQLQHRHKITPYSGMKLTGVVKQTYLRGLKIYDRGEFSAAPNGRVVARSM